MNKTARFSVLTTKAILKNREFSFLKWTRNNLVLKQAGTKQFVNNNKNRWEGPYVVTLCDPDDVTQNSQKKRGKQKVTKNN